MKSDLWLDSNVCGGKIKRKEKEKSKKERKAHSHSQPPPQVARHN